MPRWDISGPDRVHSSELRVPGEQPPRQPDTAGPSVGRRGSNDTSTDVGEGKERPTETTTPRAAARRTQHQDRDRTYSLRSSEMEAMIDIGRFRTVDIQDLSRFSYRGDMARVRQDLESLRKQGLVEEKTVFRAHKPARKVVTLTDEGHRIVTKLGGLREGQRIYHGFVKPKEIDHDVDLYRVYQKAVQEIQKQGGKPLRVRLDFELKERVNRAKEAARKLPEKERVMLLKTVSEKDGLTIKGTTIHLPDIQVEYETRDGKIERENLELLSQNYREDSIRGKVAAGFKVYVRNGEANRIRRALHDTGLVREVLSV